MAVVTVARQAGSGDDIIIPLIAERLGFDVLDSFMLARVAEQSERRERQAVDVSRRRVSSVEEWLISFLSPGVRKCILQENGCLYPKRYIDYIESVFTGIAERGNVVIVGRGGQYLLREQPLAFHVRLVADTEFRIAWMKRSGQVTGEEAMARIRHSDAMRGRFISRYFSGDWDDPCAYHLVLNTGRIGPEGAAEAVVNAVQRFMNEREFITGRKDRRKAIDRRGLERRRRDRRSMRAAVQKASPKQSLIRENYLLSSLPSSDRRQNSRRTYTRRIDDRKRLEFPVLQFPGEERW
jgi:cytidylate kinase